MKSLRKPWRLLIWSSKAVLPIRSYKTKLAAEKKASMVRENGLSARVWEEEAPSSNNTGARPWRFQKFSGDRIVSFKSKENAEKRAEEARKQGFKPIVREEKYRD